jgi:hypothetical protein
MRFKYLTGDCTLSRAGPFGQPEGNFASVWRQAWREIKDIHDTPRKFTGELLSCCRSLENLPEHTWQPVALATTYCGLRCALVEIRPRPLKDPVLTFASGRCCETRAKPGAQRMFFFLAH